jgi:hypothetical protein
MPAEVVSAVSFISKRAKRTVRAAGAGAAKVAASGAKAAKGVATGAKKAGTAVSVTIKSASPRFSGGGGSGSGSGSSMPPTPKNAA